MARANSWTFEELIEAFTLYCQIPFGRIHNRNPEIIQLAKTLGRSPSAVSLKLANFASLDPVITTSGRRGMQNASRLDRMVWDAFHNDWHGFVDKGQERLRADKVLVQTLNDPDTIETPIYRAGKVRDAFVLARVNQDFFRRAVLSNYRETCCMSGISDPRLLTASHIVPWSMDEKNRLNPHNGLCLSALHDRAFDRFLITVSPSFVVHVSKTLVVRHASPIMQSALLDLDGKSIAMPSKFAPDVAFLQWHNERFHTLQST